MQGKNSKRDQRQRKLVAALIVGAMSAAASEPALAQELQHVSADERVQFDIAGQPLSSALGEFARQAHVNALYFSDDLHGLSSPPLRGSFTRQQALDLLLERSGYNGRISGGNLVLVQERAARPQQDSAAHNGDAAVQPNASNTQGSNSEDNAGADEEIVVTGTRIRGTAPVGSELVTLDRRSIDETGVATTEQLMRTLPQVFTGGFAQHISFQGGNIGGGSSVNLRGLGADATLTLVNGHRLPVMGLQANFADISSIPTSAIERVEVLPDSASAIYGSDAVGGVVNFILRRDFDGAELGVRTGGVTSGDLRENRVTAAAGATFGDLHLFGAYEYFDRTALAMADRAFMADSDLRALGGSNFDLTRANPATLNVSGLGQFGVPTGQDGRNLTQAQLLPGVVNRANANEGLDALPDQTQNALFLSADWRLGDNLRFTADARYADKTFEQRDAHNTRRLTIPAGNAFRAVNNLFPGRTVTADYDFYRDFGPRLEQGETQTLDLSAAVDWDITNTWRFEPSLSYGRVASDHYQRNMVNTAALAVALASSDPNVAFNPFGDGSFTSPATLNNIRAFALNALVSETWTVAAKADGELMQLPAGPLRLALGGDYRHEFFQIGDIDNLTTLTAVRSTTTSNDRNVSAAYAELLIPIFGRDFAPPLGLGQSLDLSLAGRFERYSDFGDTTNPKVGLNWALTDALSLRGSWGTSFRAPNLSDLDPSGTLSRRQVRGLNITDAGAPSGRSNILLILGANPNLKEQRAESWSAGFTYAPPHSGLRLEATYFDVRFSDRIASINNIAAALNPNSEFASLIDRSPDPAEVAALLAEANTLGTSGGFSASDITVIVDARSQNLAVTDVTGMDAGLSYAFDLGGGELELSANATYLFEFLRGASPTATPVDVSDTVGNPISFRSRLGATWRNHAGAASLFINYADGYRDNLSTPHRAIDAWTTVDLHLSANLPAAFGLSAEHPPEIAFSVINLFDQDPPFVNNALGVGYDPSNADPLGRFVSVELKAHF